MAELTGEFEAVQLIVDFAPGTWTPLHTHGGPLLVTVLEGEQTVRDEQGNETVYVAGESFTETPGVYLEIGNTGDIPVVVATIALLPMGEALSTTKEGQTSDDAPPGPTTRIQQRMPVTAPLGEFEAIQLIVDFAPGTWTPLHTHGGPLLVTVLEGEQTVRDEQGKETIYRAGESFTETPGEYLEIGNAGDVPVVVTTIALLPSGETLSTTREGQTSDAAPPGPTTRIQQRIAAVSAAAP